MVISRKKSLLIGIPIPPEYNVRVSSIWTDLDGNIDVPAYWMGPNIVSARGLKSKVCDFGGYWDFGGQSADICPIDWPGPN